MWEDLACQPGWPSMPAVPLGSCRRNFLQTRVPSLGATRSRSAHLQEAPPATPPQRGPSVCHRFTRARMLTAQPMLCNMGEAARGPSNNQFTNPTWKEKPKEHTVCGASHHNILKTIAGGNLAQQLRLGPVPEHLGLAWDNAGPARQQ